MTKEFHKFQSYKLKKHENSNNTTGTTNRTLHFKLKLEIMETKFTTYQYQSSPFEWFTAAKNGNELSVVYHQEREESIKLAKLHDSAPELLESLKALHDFSSSNHANGVKYDRAKHDEVLKRAYKAINNATK